jgi:cell wall-associated NlpC family hydrolase
MAFGAQSSANAAPTKTTTAPTTSAQAKKQLTALGQQLEIVTEEYNAARIDLDKKTKAAAAAKEKVAKLDGEVAELQSHVRAMAVYAYQNGHLSSFSAFVTSTSPQSFLDRLSDLDMISTKNHGILTELQAAQQKAQQAKAEAAAAEASARQTTAELAKQKATITGQVKEMNELFSKLSAKELAEWRAEQAAASKAAAEKAAAEKAAAEQAEKSKAAEEAAAKAAEKKAAEEAAQKAAAPKNAPVTKSPSKAADPKPSPTKSPTKTATSSPPASSSRAAIALAAAESQVGKPYDWGAAGPGAYDCSGLMMWAWAKAGVSLPHSSGAQYGMGTHVSRSDLRPGDLVFFYSPIHHVGMYVGNGMIIHASDYGVPVGYAKLSSMEHYAGATRIS